MRRSRLLPALVVTAACVATPALAQSTVDIRSGEHPTFSRLVFYFDDLPPWRLEEDASGYRLRMEGDRPAFDTSTIFDFIPRTRLTDVVPGEDGLLLRSDCRCNANAFEYQDGLLVLDIRDGESDAAPGTVIASSGWQADTPPTQAMARLPFQDWPVDGVSASRTLASRDDTAADPSGPLPALFPADIAQTRSQAELRTALSRSLARAVAEGAAAPHDSATDITLEAALTDRPEIESGQLTLRTAVDLVARDAAATAERGCLPGAYFAVTQAPVQDPLATLRSARAALVEDRERPDDSAVLRLAGAYVALGFGAEARQVLATYPASGIQAETLKAMAELVDVPTESRQSALRDQVGCNTAGALWGLLASDIEPDGVPPVIAVDAVVQHLSALPRGLRSHLAPSVSRKLRQSGHANAAAAALASADRDGDAGPRAVEIVEAARARFASARPITDGDLRAIADGDSLEALAARTELMARLAGNGASVGNDARVATEAQIFAAKGSPDARALLTAYADALARSGDALHALRVIDQLSTSRSVTEADLAPAIDRTLRALVDTASDGTFLVLATDATPADLPAPVSEPLSRRIADRLASLGFQSIAQQFIAPHRTGDRDRQIAIVDWQGPLNGTLDMADTADTSARSLRQTPADPDQIAETAWRDGQWRDAAIGLEAGARRDLAGIIAATSAPGPVTPDATEPDAAESGVTEGDGEAASIEAGASTEPEALALETMESLLRESERVRTLAGRLLSEEGAQQ